MTARVAYSLVAAARNQTLYSWICQVHTVWYRNRQTARTMRALGALPDLALHDFGIHRSEIRGVARFGRLNDRC